MNVNVTHVIVHDPEQTREIIREALAIADEFADEPTVARAIFEQSCALLGQRFTFAAAPQPVSLPAMAIPGNMRGH